MQPGFTLLFSWANCHFASLYLNWDVLRLGRIQDFTEGGSIVGPPKAVPCRWVWGHPRKFKSSEMWFPMFWGLVMVFWGLVFLSQNVILINILQFIWRQQFQFRGFDRNPRTPLDPPQKGVGTSVSSGGVMRGRLSVKHKIIILICLYVQLSWSINLLCHKHETLCYLWQFFQPQGQVRLHLLELPVHFHLEATHQSQGGIWQNSRETSLVW